MAAAPDTLDMLRDSLRRALERGDASQRWQLLAGLGLLGLGIGEAFGGSGATDGSEAMAVAEELGRMAAPEPFVDAIVLAAAAIDAWGSAQQKNRWLPGISAGEIVPSWAHMEPGWRHPFEHPSLRASVREDRWLLTGCKCGVAAGSDLVVLSARIGDSPEPALFVLEGPSPPGCRLQPMRSYDGRDEIVLHMDGVPAERLGTLETVRLSLDRILGDALLCHAAETVGAMQAMLELTVSHLKSREQFGSKLSSFQVLQHRVADMIVAVEESRSMLMYAAGARRGRAGDPGDVDRALSALKVQLAMASRFVGEQAVQLHGGLGLAMEYALAPLFLRTTMLASRFGDEEFHLDRLVAAGGLYAAEAD